MATVFFTWALVTCVLVWRAHSLTLSSKLVHRFSDDARAAAGASARHWPTRKSPEYYRALVRSDLGRQKRRISARYEALFPSEGSETLSLGNDFGWLHYTWIDIGTPNISFLVALDAGSDLLWVPCDCIQCAPLTGYHGSLDKDLGMYSPTKSKTSKYLSCSHELCESGLSCKSPKQPCPYKVEYYSENTSTSGLLVEDKLYLATNDGRTAVQASVIIGCGRSQTGGYLEGAAPDGLLGLGLGDMSVPSILARAGLVRNSFSMCFQDDDSGRIFFGDGGIPIQQSTPFVPLSGKYITYIVEVESFCVGTCSPGKTKFQALVDSGSSFTFLPDPVYKKVTLEFNRRVNAPRLLYDVNPWEYCYQASPLELPEVPTVTLIFAVNKSFVVTNPIFPLYGKEGELAGFCLALQSSSESLGTIGQNFMKGYNMVFDRENLKMGWSSSDCHNLDDSRRVPLTPPPHKTPENPLPTNEQHSYRNGSAVSPAVAGKAPSAASPQVLPRFSLLLLTLVPLIFT